MLSRRQFLSIVGAVAAPLLPATRTEERSAIIIAAARKLLGTRYATLAVDFPHTTDCSTLTRWAFGQGGFALPENAYLQRKACVETISSLGALVFFWTINTHPGRVSHVAIDTGCGSIIHSSAEAGHVLEERWVSSEYWKRRFVAFGRLKSA